MSRSHIIPSIQLMHFPFVSHQSDQPFLRYGQNSVYLEKNASKKFQRKFARISIFNRTLPKSNQVITMTRAIKLPSCVVIRWVVLTLLCRQPNFLLIDATAITLGQGHGKVIQYILPDLYILCPKYLRFSSNIFCMRGKSYCSGRRNSRHGRNELKT